MKLITEQLLSNIFLVIMFTTFQCVIAVFLSKSVSRGSKTFFAATIKLLRVGAHYFTPMPQRMSVLYSVYVVQCVMIVPRSFLRVSYPLIQSPLSSVSFLT